MVNDMKLIEVLMVEDNPGDVVLVREAAVKAGLPYRITVVHDGVEARAYLHGQGQYAGAAQPDLIVLDLKLPRRSGREVLEDIRQLPALQAVPVVVLSSSRSELGLVRTHMQPTQTTTVKPGTFAGYVEVVEAIETFRSSVAARQEAGTRGDLR